jgi:hypothetical protein
MVASATLAAGPRRGNWSPALLFDLRDAKIESCSKSSGGENIDYNKVGKSSPYFQCLERRGFVGGRGSAPSLKPAFAGDPTGQDNCR